MKKFVRILGISFAIFVGILLIFYLFVRLKFPPERLRVLAKQLTAKQLDRRLDVSAVHFSPFSGFALKNITLHDSLGEKSPPFFRVKTVYLKYRFLSVFKRRIQVRKILVEQPELFVRRNADGVWNFSDLIEQTAPPPVQKKQTAPPEVPGIVKSISFELQQLAVTDAAVHADLQDSLGSAWVQLGPVSLFLDDFQIPRLDPQTLLQAFAFDLKVKAEHGKLVASVLLNHPVPLDSVAVQGGRLEQKWALDVHVRKKGTSNSLKSAKNSGQMALSVNAGLQPAVLSLNIFRGDSLFSLKNQLPTLQFRLKGRATLEPLQVHFPALSLRVGKFLRAGWQISGDSLLTAPDLVLRFTKGQMDFSRLLVYLKSLNWSENNPLTDVSVEGKADFSHLTVHARVDSVHTHVRVTGAPKMKDFSASYAPLKLALKKLDASLHFTGQVQDSLFTGGNFRARLALGSFQMEPAESLSVSAGGLEGTFSTQFGKNLVPRNLTFSFSADSLLGASVTSYSTYKVARVPTLANLKIQDFSGTTELRVKDLNLTPLLAGSARGHVDVDVLASANTGMNAFVQTRVHSADLSYLYAANLYETLPEIQFEGKGNLHSTPGFEEIDLNDFQMRVNDLVHGEMQATLFPLKQKAEAILKQLTVDFSKVRPFLPSDIQEILQLADWNGKAMVKAKAAAQLNPKTDSLELTTRGQLAVSVPYFINNEWLVNVGGIDFGVDFSGTPERLHTAFRGGVRDFMLKDVLAHPLHNTHFSGQADLFDLENVRLVGFDLNQPDVHAQVHAVGQVDSLSDVFPHIHIGGQFGVNLPKPTPVVVDINVAGRVQGVFGADSRQGKPQLVELTGHVALDRLFVEAAKTVQARGIHGKIPFRTAIDLETSLLVPSSENLAVSFPFYEIFQPYYFAEDSLFRRIAIDTIQVLNYQITHFRSDIRIRDGVILLPETKMDLYDGNIVSQIWLNLGTGALDDVAYAILAQAARINSAKFPGSRGKKRKKSLIAASVHFQGKGLDITKGLDIQGGVEVTQMGPQTTDNLLRSLDPRGVDKSIQQVRQLIRFGSKPGIISFQIRHGNLYPRIQLIQPWYLPFKISGGQVVLSRIPLSFVLNLALQSAEPAL